jgi:hypothetical protein
MNGSCENKMEWKKKDEGMIKLGVWRVEKKSELWIVLTYLHTKFLGGIRLFEHEKLACDGDFAKGI